MGSSGGGGGGGTTISKTEPWDKAKPYFERLYAAGENAYNTLDKGDYTGQLVAGTDPMVQDSRRRVLSLLPTLSQSAGDVGALAQRNLSGMYLDPASNPYLQSTMDAANSSTIRQFMESVGPGIDSAAISAGAYGGARNGLAYGRAAQGLAEELSNTNARTAYQNYATERQNQQNAPAMLQQAIQMGLAPAQLQQQIGASRQGEQQALLDSELERYNANLMAPFRGLGEWSQVLGQGGFNSSTGIMNPRSTSGGLGGALTGALGGGALAYGLSSVPALGLGALGGPMGIGIAAALGGLAGGLF